jgi:nitrogen regulatory protein PII
VEEIVRKIVSLARTGRMGDGKIFVLPVNGFREIDVAEE